MITTRQEIIRQEGIIGAHRYLAKKAEEKEYSSTVRKYVLRTVAGTLLALGSLTYDGKNTLEKYAKYAGSLTGGALISNSLLNLRKIKKSRLESDKEETIGRGVW